MPALASSNSRSRSCWIIARTFGERDYAYLTSHKNVKKRDAFEEWLYRRKRRTLADDDNIIEALEWLG